MRFHEDIDLVLALDQVTKPSIEAAFSVILAPYRTSQFWDMYIARDVGDYDEILFKVATTSRQWHLSWSYKEPVMEVARAGDFSRFGPQIDSRVEPRVPPEGESTTTYQYSGYEILIGMTAKTFRVTGVAVRLVES